VVTVEATLENTGSAEATVTPQFFENGAVFAEDSVTLATGETTTLTETYTLSEQRLHQFHIGVVEPAVIEHVGDIYPATGGAVSLSTGVDPSGTVSEGEDATFTAMATHDSGESITEYRWDFGDGTTTTTASNTATHAYSRVGSFQYTVTAIADDGATATDAGVVTVSAERILIQDGFEEGSLDNWEVERPNFALTDDALTGAKSAQLYPSGSETDDKHAYIISKDEFPQGSTYQVTFEVYGSSGDFGMSYAVQGDEDYTISYLPKGTDNPRFDIRRTKDGTTKTLATKAPEVSWGKRTTMTIENLDGEIRVTVTDGTTTDTLTATDDDPLTHGGKFRLHGYEKVIIDDLIVEK
jgi:PKD repeat protein